MFPKLRILIKVLSLCIIILTGIYVISLSSAREKIISSVHLYQNIHVVQDVNGKSGDKELILNVTTKIGKNTPRLPNCSKRGTKLLGRVFVDRGIPRDQDLQALSIMYGGTVEKGGWWGPTHCVPRVKTAIIIPYRNREKQLKMFVNHLHPILQRQEIYYRIIVVEQLYSSPFNRAALFNVGFLESLKLADFDCFIFSDVDLLPEDDRNYYGCPTSPRHMSVAVDKFNYQLPYATIFGGVGAFSKHHFKKINGFSNLYWGWGGEDDDLYKRITWHGYQLTRPSLNIGRYSMIRVHHFQSSAGEGNRGNLIGNAGRRMYKEGLNTLKYKVEVVVEEPLVTCIKTVLNKNDFKRNV